MEEIEIAKIWKRWGYLYKYDRIEKQKIRVVAVNTCGDLLVEGSKYEFDPPKFPIAKGDALSGKANQYWIPDPAEDFLVDLPSV